MENNTKYQCSRLVFIVDIGEVVRHTTICLKMFILEKSQEQLNVRHNEATCESYGDDP